ncbi:MAG: hypothetical protein ABI679_01110 [Gemmatimonadota bacterium]
MRLLPVLALSLVAGSVGTPLTAQIPTGGSIRSTPAVPLPRVMVSNPYALRSSDSAVSVQIGAAMRTRMQRVANGTYNVMTREQMNTALETFTYPHDAILNRPVQRQFASSVNARVLLSSQMARTEGGQVTLTARLAGLNDDAGSVITATQSAGQTFDALGASVADQFQTSVKAAKDAKACVDQRTTDPKKAETAAQHALTTDPKNGLAAFCLAQLAIDRKAPSDSLILLLTRATQNDPFSLPAWAALAQNHLAKLDTASVVKDYQAMIVAAATNEALRKEAFQFFLQAGRTDAARHAVEEALAMDEFNPELYDLLSNVCVFENNYRCAVDALEKLFSIDSTKADTTFYTKIVVFASSPPESPDTVRLIKWAQAGVNKYPTNSIMVSQLLGAYAMQANIDSMVSLAQRLMTMDTTSAAPALLVANELVKQKRIKDAVPLLQMVKQRGSTEEKENAAILLVNGALPLLQEPQDLPGAAELARLAITMSDSTGRAWPNANYVLGLATVIQVSKMDPETEKQKSCDMARQEDALVQESNLALTRGRSVKPEDVDKYLAYTNSLKARTASMIRAYCH